MRVVIVGAGEVGSSIAASLAETHDVVVIDTDTERIERLNYSLDVLAIEGDGASMETLEEADVESADLLVASTDDDETNLVTCGTSKALGDPFTIARVKHVGYLRTWERARDAFGVDFMVCSDLLTAEDIVEVLGLPTAVDVEHFADGRVQMAEFEIEADSRLVGQSVREADQFELLTFAAIIRNKEVTFPRGDSEFAADDRVVVIGTPEAVNRFVRNTSPTTATGDVQSVFVVGGGEIGCQTARLLQERDIRPRLVERDPERAHEAAEKFSKTVVLNFDPTDVDSLERENAGSADAVVAALDSDQKNLLVSLLAKRLGAKRTLAVVESGEYRDLFETVGVDVAVNPRVVTAEEITRVTRNKTAAKLAFVENERAEVIEVEVDSDSPLVGEAIQKSVPKLPSEVVVGAVVRDGAPLPARGGTVIEAGDRVVLFVDATNAEEVTASL